MSPQPDEPALSLLGAGDHARVVAAAAALGGIRLRGCWGDVRGAGLPLLGSDADLSERPEEWRSARFHLAFVGAPGSTARRAAAARWDAAGLAWLTIVHPGALVDPGADVEAGAYVGPGAIVNTGARVGRHAVINSAAVIEHDVRIGAGAHVAPGAVIGGGAVIGAWAFVGLGSRIRDHVEVGEAAVVAMGAVVAASVPPGATVRGVPARVAPLTSQS